MDCLFCKIISGDIPSSAVYDDDSVMVIKDINPIAHTHLLILPKKHIENLFFVVEEDKEIMGHMLLTATKLTQKLQNSAKGVKLLMNNGKHAGQKVDHMHLHFVSQSRLK